MEYLSIYLYHLWFLSFSSVQFSLLVMSDSLRPHESQHAWPPCPSPTPGVHADSHPSSQWCHSAISSSVIPLSSCPQSLPASKSFSMSQLFAWGGQSTGVSASTSVLPKNTHWVMEYYSAIKKNAFESVLMRWMKLEHMIQSEVSQKEKHQYGILMHIYGN